MKSLKKIIKYQVLVQARNKVDDQVYAEVRSHVQDQVQWRVWLQVPESHVYWQVQGKLWEEMRDEIAKK